MHGLVQDVAITGLGAACATGTGCDALWDAISLGRDGLRPVTRFSIAEFPPHVAGLWPGWDGRQQDDLRSAELAIAALNEAWAHAQLSEAGVPPERIAVVLGTCFGERFHGFETLTLEAARAIGARGPRFTVSTACASSTAAIGIGRDLIREGAADIVLAGGADVLSRQVFAGFFALGALSPGKCAPFGEPAGMTLGEGAGFVVLEAAARARSRGLSRVLGYGLSADAHHETAPDPSGSGVARAITAALEDAGLPAGAIDFVSAHGTGTDSNDPAEWLAVRSALGEQAARIPMTATKSFLGHAQGAAGVLELIAALLCMKRGLVPQTLRDSPQRAGVAADTVAARAPRAHRVRNLLKLSAGFGGANTALVVGEPAAKRAPAPPRVIEVAGLAALGAHGLTLEGLEGGVRCGATPAFSLERYVRAAPKRELDPSSKLLTAAAQLALDDAKVAIRGPMRARAGLFNGTSRIPARSAHECRASIDLRGVRGISAPAFTQMVLNAPAGTCAKLHSLKGPLLVLSAGRASGLLAIVRAAQHLADRSAADLIVAGGHEELPVEPAPHDAEGAAVVLLRARDPRPRDASPRDPITLSGAARSAAESNGSRVPTEPPRHIVQEDGPRAPSTLDRTHSTPPLRGSAQGERVSNVVMPGWGVSGNLDAAIAAAMSNVPEVDGAFVVVPDDTQLPASITRTPLGITHVSGAAEAASSAFAFVLAAARIRKRAARSLLVAAATEGLACAAVLTGGPDGQ
jgi:3-oxoacyl-[acyl-carrier-protein] synthase II